VKLNYETRKKNEPEKKEKLVIKTLSNFGYNKTYEDTYEQTKKRVILKKRLQSSCSNDYFSRLKEVSLMNFNKK
jgi:hypothetical protein